MYNNLELFNWLEQVRTGTAVAGYRDYRLIEDGSDRHRRFLYEKNYRICG